MAAASGRRAGAATTVGANGSLIGVADRCDRRSVSSRTSPASEASTFRCRIRRDSLGAGSSRALSSRSCGGRGRSAAIGRSRGGGAGAATGGGSIIGAGESGSVLASRAAAATTGWTSRGWDADVGGGSGAANCAAGSAGDSAGRGLAGTSRGRVVAGCGSISIDSSRPLSQSSAGWRSAAAPFLAATGSNSEPCRGTIVGTGASARAARLVK